MIDHDIDIPRNFWKFPSHGHLCLQVFPRPFHQALRHGRHGFRAHLGASWLDPLAGGHQVLVVGQPQLKLRLGLKQHDDMYVIIYIYIYLNLYIYIHIHGFMCCLFKLFDLFNCLIYRCISVCIVDIKIHG